MKFNEELREFLARNPHKDRDEFEPLREGDEMAEVIFDELVSWPRTPEQLANDISQKLRENGFGTEAWPEG